MEKQQLAVELLLSRELLRRGTVGTTFTVPPGSGMSGQVADTIIAAATTTTAAATAAVAAHVYYYLSIVTNASGGGGALRRHL